MKGKIKWLFAAEGRPALAVLAVALVIVLLLALGEVPGAQQLVAGLLDLLEHKPSE